MPMKPSLTLKIGQSLTMTPQLQQAIKLLQLSTLDLRTEIQAAVESNPLLEMVEDDGAGEDYSADSDHDDPNNNSAQQDQQSQQDKERSQSANDEQGHLEWENNQTASGSENDGLSELGDQWKDQQIPDDLPVDSGWDDVYQTPSMPSGSSNSEDDYDFEGRNGTTESLQDHLYWQLNLSKLTETDRAIGTAIIDDIAPDGFLTTPLEEISEHLQQEMDIEHEEVEAVLHYIQTFDPPGVAARNLKECLLIQLSQFPNDLDIVQKAKHLLTDFIDCLGARDYAQIMRKSKMSEVELKTVIAFIQEELNPRPGAQISPASTEYIVPDVVVKKIENRWLVELNPEIAPRLRVNNGYASLIKRADKSADNVYLKDQLQEARWFIKSLQSRNETLLKVATTIVERQRKFLDYGEEAMQPLVLNEVASEVDMHESTVSRVTTRKYMHTPRGIYELKYFFSSKVSTDDGGACSATAIQAMIKRLVAKEDRKKPLSDSKIAAILGGDGINVARRTIAKYREALHIPPSNERKRLL